MQTFIFLVYRLLEQLGFPLLVVYLLRRYRTTLPERFGGLPFPVTVPGGIWLHAVSVGEVLSAVGVLRRLRERFPDTPLYVSVTTSAGRQMADQRLDGLTDGIFYTPIDYCFAVRRVLRALRPTLVVVLETEIWPNLWRETRRSGARLLVVNGRISDRTLPKYLRFRWFFRHVLALPHHILAQSAQDAERFRLLGAREVVDNGNLKYDFDPDRSHPAPDVAEFIAGLAPSRVLIAASTMPPASPGDIDEDDAVIAAWPAWAAAHPGLLLILVPRRPERFDRAAERLAGHGIPFVRRTALGPLPLPGVLLLDSMGELGGLFRLADAVFMGGTLAERGGHNILEPAFFAKPVLAGPHMENFAEIAATFTEAGGLRRCAADGLEAAVLELLANPGDTGERAQRLAEARRGALDRTVKLLETEIEEAAPVAIPPLIVRILLGPIAAVWAWAAARDRRRTVPERLATPVVSVGGIGVGGSGKTPMVLRLAAQFENPAILTRGYRRLSPEPVTIVPRGEDAPVSKTGDEAQIFVRSRRAHVGIGGNRLRVGRELEKRLAPNVFLLDDGMQHHRLARDFNLVLLDALDPFAGNAPLPLGRLRESPEVLRFAHAIVLTRTQRGRSYARLIDQLPAPVYASRVVPREWIDLASGEVADPKSFRCGAFCGLANPASFWLSLRAQGIDPVHRWAFGDHHHYRHTELQRLRAGSLHHTAEVLLTTQKDIMNLPEEALELLSPLRVLWLRIDVEIDREQELIDTIKSYSVSRLL